MCAGGLERNLGAGVARADHQDAAVAQLRRAVVVAGVQLHDARVEQGGERGDRRDLVGAGRDHHVIGLEAAAGCGNQVGAVAVAGDPVHGHAGPDRQVEAGRGGIQVVGHVVSARERPALGRELPAGQPVVAGGREQVQRIPALAPDVPDPPVCLKDQERPAQPGQVVAGRQARLATADDHSLVALHATVAAHPLLLRAFCIHLAGT